MAEPIELQHDDDISDVLERLRARPRGEILLWVPGGSRLAESRFNFQLLALHGEENGQHLVVKSEDDRVLALAAGAGLATAGGRVHAMVAAPGAPPRAAIAPVPPFEEVGEYHEAGEDDTGMYDESDSAAPPYGYQPRYGPWRPDQLARGGGGRGGARPGDGRRLLAYGAAAAILLIGIVAAVILVPSATITLTTSSQQFSTPVDLTVQPGSPSSGVTVRAQTVEKQVSGTFQATGIKNTPGARASGTIQYQDHCGPLGLQVNKGAVLTSKSGVSFVQQQTVTIKADQTKTAPIQAQSEGGNGNVPAGQITTLENAGIYASCLKTTNPQATSGGQDAKHQPVVTSEDLAGAQAQLQQQAKQSIDSQLAAAARSGEKQSDQNAVVFGSPNFTADHASGSTVPHFNATLSLSGTSSYYRPAQVNSAFLTTLRSRIPAGRQLTPGNFVAQYQTTAGAGGRLEFKGQATGRIAPRLDLRAIRRHLTGSSMGSAEAYLKTLPVAHVSITQYPLPLPLLPVLGSRISVNYVIQQPPAPAPSPGTTAGSSQH